LSSQFLAIKDLSSRLLAPQQHHSIETVSTWNLRIFGILLIRRYSNISGLNCSVIQKQWHSQELPHSAPASEVRDLQSFDLNCGATLLAEGMPAEAMDLRKRAVMLSGKFNRHQRTSTSNLPIMTYSGLPELLQ
jgi:hypothetical protein